MLPVAIEERLQGHLREVERQHERDLADGVGRVVLPFALDRKYPNAATDWAWQFVFPAARICRDPRWGAPSRYHLHESAVQKAVAQAARGAALTKRVGPHTLRSPPGLRPSSRRPRHSEGPARRGSSPARAWRPHTSVAHRPLAAFGDTTGE